MGEAKRRGTFEQRKSAAIAEFEKQQAKREQKKALEPFTIRTESRDKPY